MDFELPVEYTSLIYLHQRFGDIETLSTACYIWNRLHPRDNLRIDKVDYQLSTIHLTGKCSDTKRALKICKYLTATGVLVKYRKTIFTESWEV